MKKPSRGIVLVSTGIVVLGVIICFIPVVLGESGQPSAVAVFALGVFVAFLGVIGLFLSVRLSLAVGNLIKNENVLARWQYAPAAQATRSTDEDPAVNRKNRRLWIAASLLWIILGAIFWAVFSEYSLVIILVVLFLLAISGLPYLLSSRESTRAAEAFPAEAIISLDGVYIDGHTHIWKGIGTRLESATLEEHEGSALQIVFQYSAPARGGRDYYDARVPVPAGQEDLARKVVSDISARHLAAPPAGSSR
jgi:hypothetical protein